jgi:hypothetical protein
MTLYVQMARMHNLETHRTGDNKGGSGMQVHAAMHLVLF